MYCHALLTRALSVADLRAFQQLVKQIYLLFNRHMGKLMDPRCVQAQLDHHCGAVRFKFHLDRIEALKFERMTHVARLTAAVGRQTNFACSLSRGGNLGHFLQFLY